MAGLPGKKSAAARADGPLEQSLLQPSVDRIPKNATLIVVGNRRKGILNEKNNHAFVLGRQSQRVLLFQSRAP